MKTPAKAPNSVTAAQILFFANAAIWLLIGIFSLIRLASGDTNRTVTLLVVAILMFANVGAMLGAGLGLGKRQRLLYYFAIAVLIVNILLTVTDQFGLFDLITLVIDVVLLGFLLATRAQYSATR